MHPNLYLYGDGFENMFLFTQLKFKKKWSLQLYMEKDVL